MTQKKYSWRKCICKLTHLTGGTEFLVNKDYMYYTTVRLSSSNTIYHHIGEEIIAYSLLRTTTTDLELDYIYYSCYTYLPMDFNKHFADKAELREAKINEIFNDDTTTEGI